MNNEISKLGIVVPKYLQENRLFKIEDKLLNRDDVLLPFSHCRDTLLEHNSRIETFDCSPLHEYTGLIFFCHDRKAYLRAALSGMLHRSIYVAWEPPTVDPLHGIDALRKMKNAFGRILTWNENLINEEGFSRIRYAQAGCLWNVGALEFSRKKLIANISGDKSSKHAMELYSERRRILRHFQDAVPEDLLMYGPGWSSEEFSSYRGMATSKSAAYGNCKFGLCFENMHGGRGYITEKIFDCFRAGVVPVYCGAPDICEYMPQESFVAYSPEDGPASLLDRLVKMDATTHSAMLQLGRAIIEGLNDSPFSPKAMAQDLLSAFAQKSNEIRAYSAVEYVAKLSLRNFMRRIRR